MPSARRFVLWFALSGAFAAAGLGRAAGPSPAVPSPTDDAESPASAASKPDPAAEKFWQSIPLLESKSAAEQARGRAALQEAADLEFTHAQRMLAQCHFSGSYGFRKDAKKGFSLMRLAAERGNAFAKVTVGQCYFAGIGTRSDREKAAGWLLAALTADADYSRPLPPEEWRKANSGKPSTGPAVAGAVEENEVGMMQATAHFLLGLMLEEKKDQAGAQAHFVAAATAGPAGREGLYPAAIRAALNFAFGQGVPRDMVRAREMLERSRKLTTQMNVRLLHNYAALKFVDEFAVADLEDAATAEMRNQEQELQAQIADTFNNRKSKEYDPREAAKWYELAAESGRGWAMLNLAFLYASNDLGTPDPAAAFAWFKRAGEGENPKHFLGTANLAICYLGGIGTPPDPEKAAALFHANRDKDFICYLGSIGQAPRATVTYEQAVALNQIWAQEKKDPGAQFFMGERCRNGLGVAENYDQAIVWYRLAAQAGNGPALYRLGQEYQFHSERLKLRRKEDPQVKAGELYERGLAAGNADCISALAYQTDSGLGRPADANAAAALYEKSLQIDPASSMAHNNLGVICEGRLRSAHKAGRPSDPAIVAAMLQHYEEASRLGGTRAASNLGLLYRSGELLPKDLPKAYGYFSTAAERGSVGDRYTVGWMHEFGEGVPVSYTEAAFHYRLAALEGHYDALRRLVEFYTTGKGMSQDLDRAAFWLSRLAEKGEYGAVMNLCDIALHKQDYKGALRLLENFRQSIWPSHQAYAYDRLSLCYLNGWGVKPNPARAESHLAKAVELGQPEAIFRSGMHQIAAGKTAAGISLLERAAPDSVDASFALGQMYFHGTNLPRDHAKAWPLLRFAATGGLRDALYFLAAATYNRVPGAPALDEALRFSEQAENAGHPKAARLRALLEKRRDAGDAAPREESAAPRQT